MKKLFRKHKLYHTTVLLVSSRLLASSPEARWLGFYQLSQSSYPKTYCTVAEGIESWLLGEKLRICRKPNSLVSSRSLPPSLLLSPYSYRKKKKNLEILWWNLSFSSPRLVKLVAVSPIHGTSRPARDHDWLWSIWKFPCHSGCLEGNIWCWSKLINLPSLLFSEKSESVSRSVMSDSLWPHGL